MNKMDIAQLEASDKMIRIMMGVLLGRRLFLKEHGRKGQGAFPKRQMTRLNARKWLPLHLRQTIVISISAQYPQRKEFKRKKNLERAGGPSSNTWAGF
jgi:hypothetical protein